MAKCATLGLDVERGEADKSIIQFPPGTFDTLVDAFYLKVRKLTNDQNIKHFENQKSMRSRHRSETKRTRNSNVTLVMLLPGIVKRSWFIIISR